MTVLKNELKRQKIKACLDFSSAMAEMARIVSAWRRLRPRYCRKARLFLADAAGICEAFALTGRPGLPESAECPQAGYGKLTNYPGAAPSVPARQDSFP